MAPKYLHFLLPMFDVLFAVHFFPLEVAEKDLTVKRLITGRRVVTSSPSFSAVVIYITTTGTNTGLFYQLTYSPSI